MLCSVIEDIFNTSFTLFFSPMYETEGKRIYDAKVKAKLTLLSEYIKDQDFFMGYLTLADFKLAEAAMFFEKIYSTQYGDWKMLERSKKVISSLPAVKSYLEKKDVNERMMVPPYAKLKC